MNWKDFELDRTQNGKLNKDNEEANITDPVIHCKVNNVGFARIKKGQVRSFVSIY